MSATIHPYIRPAGCEHKTEIGCVLTALSICCACADQRPEAPAYPVYIDGEGMKMQGKRWGRYCWKCRDYYNSKFEPSGTETTTNATTAPNSGMAPPYTQQWPNHHFNPLAQSFPSPDHPQMLQQPFTQSPTYHGPHINPMGQRSAPIPVAQRANVEHISYNPHAHPPTMPRPQGIPPIYPLGTREDVEQEDYQSPIGQMFQRAYERYRTVEQTRQEYAAALGVPVNVIRTMNSQADPRYYNQYVGLGEPIYPGTNIQLGYPSGLGPPSIPPPASRRAHANPLFVSDVNEDEPDENAIDRQTNRPEPLTNEEMTISIACKMCMEQKIDTLIEPCMHLAICRWCSDVWQTNARRLRQRDPGMHQAWKCPVCRKGIQQVRRVYF